MDFYGLKERGIPSRYRKTFLTKRIHKKLNQVLCIILYYACMDTRKEAEELENRITQLRKGILELAILGALQHGSHYGYSLVRVLSRTGALDLKEGTIYPILSRMHRDGLVKSQWVESSQGPPRKYYSLTASGSRQYLALTREFEQLVEMVRESNRNPEIPREPKGPLITVRKEPKNE